jgi:hypothetical protein
VTEEDNCYPLLFSEDSNTSAFEQVCDVFIAWTMRCAEKKYEAGSKFLNHNAKRMLSFLVTQGTGTSRFDNNDILEVKTYRQESISKNRRIDIRVVVKLIDEEYQIVIENKFDDVMQEEQLRAYKAIVPKKFPSPPGGTVYIAINSGSTNDEAGKQLCEKAGFTFFYVYEIANACFKKENGDFAKTGNPLFDEFWIRWPKDAKKKSAAKS